MSSSSELSLSSDEIDYQESNLNLLGKVLDKYNVPKQFLYICDYFLKPDFGDNPTLNKASISKKFIISLDYLIWNWKSPLSREWYPFLLGLKQDIKIFTNEFNSERIVKTQTKALANYLINN